MLSKEELAEIYSSDVLKAYEENSVHSYMIGGSHYKNKIEPWDIIDSWGLNFYEGNILKYLLRHKDNRVQDIKKLIHYAEKLLELENGKSTKV